MPRFDIKHHYNEQILYTGEGETIAAVLEKAVRDGANLTGANLARANLAYANLARANLARAYLAGANLAGANLADADLARANLAYANLARANLTGANLAGANLAYAYPLPAPAVVLAAGNWGELSDELTADLMLWDAANHPDPEAFDKWAKGGACPYADTKVSRACQFQEKKHLWGKGEMCRPYDLMIRLLAEKCPNWTDEQIKEFEAKFKKERP
jgi:hypothetical protein